MKHTSHCQQKNMWISQKINRKMLRIIDENTSRPRYAAVKTKFGESWATENVVWISRQQEYPLRKIIDPETISVSAGNKYRLSEGRKKQDGQESAETRYLLTHA